VLKCFRSHHPSISLEPTVQGPIKGFAEAARDDFEDTARAVAERFERETEDALASRPAGSFLLFLSFQ
jgi:hypothetical protein